MKVLLMTADEIPLKPISVEKAITGLWEDKYRMVKKHPTKVFRSPSIEIPVPLAVAPYRYVPLPGHYFGPANLNNENLFLRDNFTCVYCHEEYPHERLTRDHVLPRSKGGKDIWENVVTACEPCNLMKGNQVHSYDERGHKVWDLVNPQTGAPVRFTLDFVPKTPSKASVTFSKNVKKGLIAR